MLMFSATYSEIIGSEHINVINIPPFATNVPLFHAGYVAADTDSAEDVADDPEAAVDEEEDDEEEILVEEDQMRPAVCVL